MRSRRPQDRFPRRSALIAALAAMALSACAQAPELAPETAAAAAGGGGAGETVQGVTLEVIPDSWRYDPRDLPERVVPVRVRVVNHRAEPILVSLTDASLVEEGAAPRIAMTPGEVVQATVRGGGRKVGGSRGLGLGGIGIQLGGMAVGGPGWSVGTSGVPMGPGAPAMEGGMDALRVGIRPGRLDPGANVEGYLFFGKPLQRRDRDRRYRLAWVFRPLVPMGAPPAAPVVMVEVPLVAR